MELRLSQAVASDAQQNQSTNVQPTNQTPTLVHRIESVTEDILTTHANPVYNRFPPVRRVVRRLSLSQRVYSPVPVRFSRIAVYGTERLHSAPMRRQ